MLKHSFHQVIAPIVYNRHTAIVPRRLQPLWPERVFLRDFLKWREVDCVVDVGANAGQYASELRLLGYTGLILSFEPDPVTFTRLSKMRANDSKWLAFNHALGAETSTATMNVMANSVYNSFHNPSVQETASDSTGNVVVSQIEVPIRRLDELLLEIQSAKNARKIHLKMDTQGHDIQVFQGCRGLLSRVASMQSEIPLKRIYEGIPHWRDVLHSYEEAGFEVHAFFRVNPHRMNTVEMDCFLINAE